MQISVQLVDWDWLVGLPGAEAQTDALLNLPVEHVIWGGQIPGGWCDSATMHWEVGSGLAAVAAEADKMTADLIRAGFPLLVDYRFERPVDELGLRQPGSHFFASVSPETVKPVAAAARQLNLKSLAVGVDVEDEVAAEEYLGQWVEVFTEAARQEMGIVGHIG
jgi:hypothetical protein